MFVLMFHLISFGRAVMKYILEKHLAISSPNSEPNSEAEKVNEICNHGIESYFFHFAETSKTHCTVSFYAHRVIDDYMRIIHIIIYDI